jgi:hypothetical protein
MIEVSIVHFGNTRDPDAIQVFSTLSFFQSIY